MTDQPSSGEPEPPDDVEAAGTEAEAPRPRIPEPDPDAREHGKRYMRANAPLKVIVDGGDVAKNYAPVDVVAKVIGAVGSTLKAFGGGFTPMFYEATPGGSMTLVFGDPQPADAQAELPVEFTLNEAQRVAELIELDGDDFFRRALLVGEPMKAYSDLAQIVQSESVTLRWEVRGEKPRHLTADRAHRHHARLTSPPKTQDRPITVNGSLYRVITESTRDGYVGSVGIHLHGWSSRPPKAAKKARIIARYDNRAIERAIKDGLVGEPVEATLLIRHAVPGTSIDPERFDLVVQDIKIGAPEGERTTSFFEDDEQ